MTMLTLEGGGNAPDHSPQGTEQTPDIRAEFDAVVRDVLGMYGLSTEHGLSPESRAYLLRADLFGEDEVDTIANALRRLLRRPPTSPAGDRIR